MQCNIDEWEMNKQRFLKSLMIIFNKFEHDFTENQVKQNCFSPVSVHLEILPTQHHKLFLGLLYKIQ